MTHARNRPTKQVTIDDWQYPIPHAVWAYINHLQTLMTNNAALAERYRLERDEALAALRERAA